MRILCDPNTGGPVTAQQVIDAGTEQDGILYVPDCVFEQMQKESQYRGRIIQIYRHVRVTLPFQTDVWSIPSNTTYTYEILTVQPDRSRPWPADMRLPEGL